MSTNYNVYAGPFIRCKTPALILDEKVAEAFYDAGLEGDGMVQVANVTDEYWFIGNVVKSPRKFAFEPKCDSVLPDVKINIEQERDWLINNYWHYYKVLQSVFGPENVIFDWNVFTYTS